MSCRVAGLTTGSILFVFISVITACAQNHPPLVQIIKPDSGAALPVGQLIPFRVHVSDKEDGDSKYDEINSAEVFLKVQEVAGPAEANAALKDAGQLDEPGFVLLQKSNCSNCHAFRAPGIGPSYADICSRYPNSVTNVMVLTQRVLSGASGVWGTQVMPSHPEFTRAQAQEIVSWILSNADKPSTTYYTGTEGALVLKPAKGNPANSIFVLRASYTDHGISGDSLKVQGQDVIVVHGKQ